MKEYDKRKAIKAADLIDVSDKPTVSNIRVGILYMFFLSPKCETPRRDDGWKILSTVLNIPIGIF
jgi:hypothetical protein